MEVRHERILAHQRLVVAPVLRGPVVAMDDREGQALLDQIEMAEHRATAPNSAVAVSRNAGHFPMSVVAS
ncbi:MAG: hypothetical protein WDO24_00155 [Pseudomonadota bacterium]